MLDTIRKNNLFFRQLLFIAILVVMGVVILRELRFFIGAFLGAITFYIVLRGVLFRLVERHGWRPGVASLVIVAGICMVLFGLGFVVFEVVASEIRGIDLSHLPALAHQTTRRVNDFVGFNLVSTDIVQSSMGLFTRLADSVLTAAYSFVINILMTILTLYFMLANARALEAMVAGYVPFSGESRRVLLADVTSIIYSNAVGLPLMMLSQGLTAATVYWLFGIPNVAFWAFLTALCGLVPVVGTLLVSLPLGIWFITQGLVLKGVGLMICGLVVIANIDSLVRIVLNKRIAGTHPLVVIFGVIMGIKLFGFWGIVFGPLVISLFMLLFRIYYKEYKLLDPTPVPEMHDSVAEQVTEREKEDTKAEGAAKVAAKGVTKHSS